MGGIRFARGYPMIFLEFLPHFFCHGRINPFLDLLITEVFPRGIDQISHNGVLFIGRQEHSGALPLDLHHVAR
ncbi:hypothetical protein D3C75_582810 [compost metagenome]